MRKKEKEGKGKRNFKRKEKKPEHIELKEPKNLVKRNGGDMKKFF